MPTLSAVWGASSSDVYAGGAQGTVLHLGAQDQTLITLASFTASRQIGLIVLSWNTVSELDNAGFNLYRADAPDGEYVKINTSLIPAKGSAAEGMSYEFIDRDVRLWQTYYYKLEDIDLHGTATLHGPVSAAARLTGVFR